MKNMPPIELERLNADMMSDRKDVRLNALKKMEELARAGQVDETVLPSLMFLLKSSIIDERRKASWIVAKLAQNKVDALWPLETFNNRITDEDPEVRENMAWALGELAGMRIGIQGSITHLTDLLLDEEAMVRGMAAWALGRFAERLNMGSPRAQELLEKRIRDESPYVSKSASYALERMR
ncbi:MAG: HEAT repeat domain-containing protein [Euryarchaeota archaeon]|nr:HEAT repeat domain-containing protein [Euryarchaeota archaeon]